MGYDSGYYEEDYFNADWYFDGIDILAVTLAEEEKKIFNDARMRRQRQRMVRTIPSAPIEQPPPGPPAQMVVPNPELVARIAAQLKNVRGTTARPSRRFGGGTDLG